MDANLTDPCSDTRHRFPVVRIQAKLDSIQFEPHPRSNLRRERAQINPRRSQAHKRLGRHSGLYTFVYIDARRGSIAVTSWPRPYQASSFDCRQDPRVAAYGDSPSGTRRKFRFGRSALPNEDERARPAFTGHESATDRVLADEGAGVGRTPVRSEIGVRTEAVARHLARETHRSALCEG